MTFSIFKNRKIAYLSLPLFLLPKFIGGTATMTFDIFFGYRSVGLIFLIFYLAYLLEKKWTKSLFFAALGFFFHPLSIVPAIFTFPSLYAAQKKLLKPFLKIATLSLLLVLTLVLLLLPKDLTWLEIIKTRDDYLFTSTWSTRGWAAMFLYLSLVFLFLNYLSKSAKKQILLVVAASLTVFLINFALLEIIKIPHIAQLQLVRSITPIAYIALTISPLFLIPKNFLLRIIGAVAYVALSVNAFWVFLLSFFLFAAFQIIIKYQSHWELTPSIKRVLAAILTVVLVISIIMGTIKKTIEYKQSFSANKEPKGDWQKAQIWAKENTPPDSAFMVPPNKTGFRIFSERPILGDIKDGAVVMYSSIYAKKWIELMQDLESYYNFGEDDFENLKVKYDFDYLITPAAQNLNFIKVYQNTSFTIYQI